MALKFTAAHSKISYMWPSCYRIEILFIKDISNSQKLVVVQSRIYRRCCSIQVLQMIIFSYLFKIIKPSYLCQLRGKCWWKWIDLSSFKIADHFPSTPIDHLFNLYTLQLLRFCLLSCLADFLLSFFLTWQHYPRLQRIRRVISEEKERVAILGVRVENQ